MFLFRYSARKRFSKQKITAVSMPWNLIDKKLLQCLLPWSLRQNTTDVSMPCRQKTTAVSMPWSLTDKRVLQCLCHVDKRVLQCLCHIDKRLLQCLCHGVS